MLGYNLWMAWYIFDDIAAQSNFLDSRSYDSMQDCKKTRPEDACLAEYERALEKNSRWRLFHEQNDLTGLALLELLPAIAIGLVWLILWCVFATARWVIRGFGVPQGQDSPILFKVAQFPRSFATWLCLPRNLLLASLVLPCISVSYYFAIALPESSRARLQFEHETAEAARLEKEAEEQAVARSVDERKSAFRQCEIEVEDSYLGYVKLNGKPVPGKPGIYSASIAIWGEADKKKAQALAECHRRYDR